MNVGLLQHNPCGFDGVPSLGGSPNLDCMLVARGLGAGQEGVVARHRQSRRLANLQLLNKVVEEEIALVQSELPSIASQLRRDLAESQRIIESTNLLAKKISENQRWLQAEGLDAHCLEENFVRSHMVQAKVDVEDRTPPPPRWTRTLPPQGRPGDGQTCVAGDGQRHEAFGGAPVHGRNSVPPAHGDAYCEADWGQALSETESSGDSNQAQHMGSEDHSSMAARNRCDASEYYVSRWPGGDVLSAEVNSEGLIDDETVTLLIQNVPARFRRDYLVEIWPPRGSYNFLYLPFKRETRTSVGIVFINFFTPQGARDFFLRWNRKKLPNHGSSKTLRICRARLQGFNANIQYLIGRNVFSLADEAFRPVLFTEDGERVRMRLPKTVPFKD